MAIYIDAPISRRSGEKIESDGRVKASYVETRLIRYTPDSEGPFGGPVGYLTAAAAAWTAFPYLSPSAVDPWMRLKSRDIVQQWGKDLGTHYELTLNYDNEPFDTEEEVDNPLNRPIKISSRGQSRTVACDKDVDGKPILTSAKMPPTNLPEKETSDRVFSIEANTATWNEAIAVNYVGKLNSATFLGKPPRSVLCTDVGAESAFENDVPYFKRSLEFQFRQGGWDFRRLDCDVWRLRLNRLNKMEQARITNDEGDEITDPIPLNGNGQVIPREELPDAAHFFTDKLHEEIDLNALLS